MKPAVFLDRDGVVNEAIISDGKPYAPKHVSELVIAGNTEDFLKRLKESGFLLIVFTNQPDVARGAISRDTIEEIHNYLCSKLPIDDMFVCWHDDADHCNCRKPLPGLIFQAAKKHGIDLHGSYVIGDRWRDIDAGTAAGCQTVFINRHYNERAPASPPQMSVPSLAEGVEWIIAQAQPPDVGNSQRAELSSV